MSKVIRLGYISVEDANDVKLLSGTPYHLKAALQKQNVDLQIFSPLKSKPPLFALVAKCVERCFRKKINIERHPVVLKFYAQQIARMLRFQPVDVLLSVSTIPITLLQSNVPIVVYTDAVYHMMPGYYWQENSRRDNAGRSQEERALMSVTRAVYASNWAADGARRLTNPDKISVVPFGASVAIAHNSSILRQWVSERVKRIPHELRLLFVGKDFPRKGGEFAIEVARLLNDAGVNVLLTIVGSTPVGVVPNYVKALGYINKDSAEGRNTLSDLYISAHFFILPTRAEAAGIVFCESSAFGLPSLTLQTGGVGDYVRDGINGFCLPIDSKPKDFTDRILQLSIDSDRYSVLCYEAFNEYETRLNWDITAAKLVRICQDAVESTESHLYRARLEMTKRDHDSRRDLSNE